MADVLVKPAFQSAATDSGDTTKLGPNAWNAARLFSGGTDGQVVTRDSASATGASWGSAGGTATALQLPNNTYSQGRNQANTAWINMFRVGTTDTIEVGNTLACASITFTGTITGPQFTATGTGGFSAPSGGFFSIAGRGFFSASADAVWTLTNAAGTVGAQLALGKMALTDGVTAPGATSGLAKIYVDTADGDLKVVFGDGVVKTLAVDT